MRRLQATEAAQPTPDAPSAARGRRRRSEPSPPRERAERLLRLVDARGQFLRHALERQPGRFGPPRPRNGRPSSGRAPRRCRRGSSLSYLSKPSAMSSPLSCGCLLSSRVTLRSPPTRRRPTSQQYAPETTASSTLFACCNHGWFDAGSNMTKPKRAAAPKDATLYVRVTRT